MATVTPLSTGVRAEHRDLTFWMDRVLKELDNVRTSPDVDAVHDLRVAIRRCRSVAAVMEEIDPDPAWPAMRKAARKLFRSLGALRDAQVMDEWVKKLAPESDPVRAHLQTSLESGEPALREAALRAAAKFDPKSWRRLARTLRQRARLVPAGSLAAECVALERFEDARDLHAKALRTEKPRPWHALRIGVKRFRYTAEHFLPEQHAVWSDNLKRIQDLLGEIHDLDVLSGMVDRSDFIETEDSLKLWHEAIARERSERIETYRQLTLGKTSLWNLWRAGLPTNGRVEAAAQARLRATARAVDPHSSRTSQVSRIALAIFEGLKKADAAPAFHDAPLQRILLAAARLHGVGDAHAEKSPQKAARKFLQDLALPPGWSNDEWDLLATVVRYHRGAEPSAKNGPFSKLASEQQARVRALAGILRLARALRKTGVQSGAGIRAEKSAETVILRIPSLVDDLETASRLAAGKHLLEEYLAMPLILKAAVKPGTVVALPPRQLPEFAVIASD
ncbi:MAG TPA: CHAD domain-containing protein [Candidatus Angelobacter sp.]|nr:CHAD domain-containing protein [Candidatus Angelobacter sp.]